MPSNPITLEDAIALLVSQATSAGIRLTRTKLVKLLYFVDLRAWEQLGQTVTGVEWIWHHYGPYSPSIVEACERMAASDELEVRETSIYYDPPGRDLVNLVRTTLRDFGRLAPAKIGDLSYETEPMRRLVASGHRGDTIEFESAPPSRSDVRSAVNRYKKVIPPDSGRDEGEVATGIRDELAGLAASRRSATRRMLIDR